MRCSLLRLQHSSLSIALASSLVACSVEQPQQQQHDEPLGEATEAVTNVCPPGTTVSGIDIAAYQHPGGAGINWGQVATAEKYVIIKATEGTGYTNSYYAGDASGARAAGLVVGAYHFLAPSSQTGASGAAQADYFATHAAVGPNDMPPMLDLEASQQYNSVLPSVADVVGWLQEVEVKTGRKPFVYVGYYTLQSLGNPSQLASYLIDVPSYGACPNFPNNYPIQNLIIWQDSSTKAVPGISGSVDHDVFYGDLAAFDSFAHGGANWAAQYVAQSWPLASTTMTLTVNQEVPASITLKNVGKKTWDTNTKLATTQARDRASPFVGPDWLAPNRLSHVTGTVAPGANFDFKFTFKAPNTPGMYDEFYGVVEESQAWFSDPGQGGPPDNDIEAKFQVVEAPYHGQFVSQTFPTLQQPAITMASGDTMDGTITLKNVGTAVWKAGETKLAPTPRDKPSPIGGAGWLSPTRVSSPTADVPPGGTFSFPLKITAGAPGDYTQTFSLVEEAVTWFADAPKGGGPPDNQLAIHVLVTPGTSTNTTSTMGTGATMGIGTGVGGSGAGGSGAGGSGGNNAIKGGCSCRVDGEDTGERGAAWLVVLGAAALVRRRRAA